jgi:hypothetical protein
MEVILMKKSREQIGTSDLQFAYKAKHSTSMCTLMLKETVNHFLNRGTGVYCCLIDASKAFDRIRQDELFRILQNRGVSACLRNSLLINCYSHQEMTARWNGAQTEPFGALNGVKQGGIFSPILFCCYMDILLERLRDLGIGCHIGQRFVGALSYADDLTLLAPSLRGLREMLKICEVFALNFDVMFNPSKSEFIFLVIHPILTVCPISLFVERKLNV